MQFGGDLPVIAVAAITVLLERTFFLFVTGTLSLKEEIFSCIPYQTRIAETLTYSCPYRMFLKR